MHPFRLTLSVALGAVLASGASAPAQAQSTAPAIAKGQARAPLAQTQVPADMALIPASEHQPLYPSRPDDEAIAVKSFLIDKYPVTNQQYLDFVRENPRWQRGKVPVLFASEHYLRHWEGPLSLGEQADPKAPVVYVSWFAAKAYCSAHNKRLPTEAEWEVAGAASETEANAGNSPEWRQKILGWYSKPTPKKQPPVGQGEANYYGIHDLHGLVWEWIADFNAYFVKSDSRGRDEDAGARFCGAAGLESSDTEDYASFMRSAMRGSLEGKYTGSGMGFRCVRDYPPEQ